RQSQNSAPPRSLISGVVCTQLDVFKSNASIDYNLRYCSSVNDSIPIAFTISTTVFFGGYFFLASSACRSYQTLLRCFGVSLQRSEKTYALFSSSYSTTSGSPPVSSIL